MRTLKHFFDNNQAWSERISRRNPDFFKVLSKQQAPECLWIGCSDSRVPANEIVDLLPGELFVHRNVANIVMDCDINCMSVMQYAIDILRVKHVVVCGHYGCGGVRAVLEKTGTGLVENWLQPIRAIYQQHYSELCAIDSLGAQTDRLCELNVITQVHQVCQSTIVQKAWACGRSLSVHGWIYGLKDGLLRDLNVTCSGEAPQ